MSRQVALEAIFSNGQMLPFARSAGGHGIFIHRYPANKDQRFRFSAHRYQYHGKTAGALHS
ncbi:MAG: hypothetical protein U5J95_03660 [Balneolaceae bacterium]|nr:hypothetical protein [Balneolaceae bacterium]